MINLEKKDKDKRMKNAEKWMEIIEHVNEFR